MRLQFILLCCAIVSFSACEKESTDPQIDNSLTIDGQNTELIQAIVQNNGEYDGFDESFEGHHMIIGIYSSEVTIVHENGIIDEFTGTGDGVEFEIFAENPASISNQVYELSDEYTSNTFSFAAVYSNFNFETGSLIDALSISDGTLTVSLTERELTLNSTLTIHPTGEIVTVSYKGDYIESVPE